MSNKALMCGGPADGKWLPFAERSYMVYVAEPIKLAISDIDSPPKMLDRYRYAILPFECRVMYSTRQIWIGVDDSKIHWEDTVFRTVLQRDVWNVVSEGR